MFPWAVLILVSLTLWALIGLRLRRFAAAVCFPRLKDVDCPVDLGVIIPARNEERDLPDCLRSLLQQEGVHPHIVVVDDGSADDTAAIAAAILEPAGGLVKSAGPPPPGWTGKNWALRAGLQGFAHDLILFLDADVRLLDTRVLAATAATIRDGDADVVGLLPGLSCRTALECMLMPLFAVLYPLTQSAAANKPLAGAFILADRRAYEHSGGHAAVRGKIVEDLALAHRLTRSGARIALMQGYGVIEVNMFHCLAEAWQVVRRLSVTLLHDSLLYPAGAWLAAGAAVIFPWVALAFGGWAAAAGGVLLLLQAVTLRRLPLPLRGGRLAAALLLLPAGALFMCLACSFAAVDFMRGRGTVWKGRRYS